MAYLLLSFASLALAATPFDTVSPSAWKALNASVHGRLNYGVPNYELNRRLQPGASACEAVKANWTETHLRVQQFGAYEQIFSERLNGDACSLNALDPNDPTATTGRTCFQGSIPPYYIDVQTADDVIAGINVAKKTGVQLIVKNTGHDYIGRSSAPKSLALWMKHLTSQKFSNNFVPEGCKASAGRTMTNGVTNVYVWLDVAYPVANQNTDADANNATVVGGAFQTVGASGGWMLGGGHGFLTGKDGVGVDSILQYKVVTPDGKLRVANKCQNQDLFWAMRGGGPGFGIDVESTIKAHPACNMKVALVQVQNISVDAQFDVFRVFGRLRTRLGKEGWGGAFLPEFTPGQMVISMVNPTLSDAEALATFKPVIDYVNSLNGKDGIQVLINGFQPGGSYLFVQRNYISTVPVGLGAFIGSRLLPVSSFESDAAIDALIPALKAGLAKVGPGVWPPMELLMDTPLLTPDTDSETSVNPAWRTSAFVMVFGALIEIVHDALQVVRDVTPGSGSYLNEADILEPNYEEAFWGKNYMRLLEIKKKYDPTNLLTGWNYVGFNKNDPMFARYNL
ncbi:FAD-binding domain-containing protein [Mycena crocata]|nr:FAD-binding domain-containing protein [Mycena crocata]